MTIYKISSSFVSEQKQFIMCSILAIVGKQDKALIAEHSSRMSHRGPDERDYLVTKIGTLAHERLSIVGIDNGKQPIQGTRNCYMVHNGEIYNHEDIFSKLKDKTTKRTKSDSEAIVRLYEEHSFDFCHLLDGIFAFVILDDDKSRFMAARDPLGVKPLYYGVDKDGAKWFASELKAIVDVCEEMFAFPPGHYYTEETGFVKYYRPLWETEIAEGVETKSIRPLLEEAIDKRMKTDLPLGVLLSGGLDSSIISAVAARKVKAKGGTLKSFSIGLNKDAPDLKYARMAAEFIGTEHHEVYFSIEEGIANLSKLIWHLESYDVTTIRASTPMYFLTRYIKEQGIKVLLSGEGADEIFGGYLYFFNAPDDYSFQEETKRRVKLLHTADVLRADKSTMANGVEVRVPFLDKAFLENAIALHPELKRPKRSTEFERGKMEKYVLRKAFDDSEDPILPDAILWRQKEQFSDGVGYGWIDGLQDYCNKTISDEEFSKAEKLFPYNTPETKEALLIRKIFHQHFPYDAAVKTVKKWIPKWQTNTDPSGRANSIHAKAMDSPAISKEAEKIVLHFEQMH